MTTSVFRIYSKDLLPLYLFVCILFIMGVVFGALLVNALTLQQKQDVGQYVSTFLTSYSGVGAESAGMEQAAPPNGSAVWDAFGSHARWVFFIWILGLSVVGVPIILLLDFMKGVLVGFTVGYLVGQWSWKGMVFALASVAPQNLIVVPAIMVCSVAAISFSIVLVRNRLWNRSGTVGQPLAAFSLTALTLTAILFAVSLFEVYLSPGLLEWAAPMLLEQV
jgi:stage II sporulation protein M